MTIATQVRIDQAPDVTASQVRRQLSNTRVGDVLALLGSAIASLALTAFASLVLAPVRGAPAFIALTLIVFVGIYAAVAAITENGPAVRDRVAMVVVHTLAFAVLLVLVFIVVFTVARALPALPHPNFYTQDMSLAGPLDPLDVGGVLHAITGTMIQIGIALAITIPLGLATAVFLSEIPGPFARFVRTVVEAMTALPSIVAGLFIYATAIYMFGLDKSGFAAALAISIMMLPIMIRSADVVLRLVPHTLKEAAYGLGSSQWKTVWQVVLPTSRSGLTTAIILATARGIGETSPVLLTSGFTAAMNTNPLSGPMVSLPLAIFQFVKSPEPNMIARGFGTAAVLMALVVTLFVIARVIGADSPAKKARRQDRREAVLHTLTGLVRRATRARRGRGDRPASEPDEARSPAAQQSHLPTSTPTIQEQ
ncbi:phosphate ABC transporter permease PstA [Rarobacter faecitabidus]|uniref:Phosphate transport system permease protein PstA n=1 Tax=Rarobacter faecitabidus TaxID=13243 RepID=A0A542ZX37_RARFA|nr:phosphate ABC transporter permease PstA [Rarobacter faecitabidus]TQL64917.1 phosphate ABC transporter membrane protein 2 (PhoT family) [Rarobacter faecitabidus]